MPFGAVFTTSDPGGGRLRTRFRGPILAGYASTADPGGQTLLAGGGSPAGSAASPIYSFYTRPDAGMYASIVTSSAGEIRFSIATSDIVQITSAGIALISSGSAGAPTITFSTGAATAGLFLSAAQTLAVAANSNSVFVFSTGSVGVNTANIPVVASAALLSSATNLGALYIPQTTYAVSSSSGTSSGATPTAFGSGAALIFDSLRNKLSVFSTIANQWLSVSLSSS